MITLITGDNTYAISQRLQAVKAGFIKDNGRDSLEQYEAQDFPLEKLPDAIGGASLFGDKRMLIIKNIGANKELASKIAEKANEVDDSIELILTQPGADKRTEWYKKLKPFTSEENTLAKGAVLPWLRKETQKRGLEVKTDVLELLVQRTGEDQWRLNNELDKLELLESNIDRQTILNLVEPTDEENVFALVDLVLAGKVRQALSAYDAMSNQGLDAYQFISTLSWQLSQMIVVKLNKELSPADIAAQSGGSLWAIRRIKPMVDKLSYAQLEQLADMVVDTEYRLKSTAEHPDQRVKWLIGSMSEVISS